MKLASVDRALKELQRYRDTATVGGTTRQHILTGLQEFSNYTVTVVAVNDAGRSEENSVNVVTMADGMYVCTISFNTMASFFFFFCCFFL